MNYRLAMTLFAVPLVPIAMVMMLAPEVLGGMMGLPLEPALAALCDGHETAKMEMVRALGGWQLTLAIMLLVVRNVQELQLQRRLLQTFVAASVIHIGINLHTVMIGNISTFGWIPVVISSVFLVICLIALAALPAAAIEEIAAGGSSD